MADDEELEHPALKNFSEGAFTAKHIAGKAIKFGAIGAAVGGTLLAGAVAAGAAFTPIGWIATAGTYLSGLLGFTGGVAGAASTLFTTGLLAGGATGAAVGTAMGAASADDAVRDKKDEIVAQADRMEVRQERVEVAKAQRDQQAMALEVQAQQMGLRPDMNLPNRGMEGPSLS